MIYSENRFPLFGILLLGYNEDIFAAFDDFEFAQLEFAVADAFAGLDVVFVAVPRADEVHLVAVGLALIGAVGGKYVDHVVDHHAFAGRPALVQASVAVGVVRAAVVEHADFAAPRVDDAAVAVGEFGGLGNEPFGHVMLQ